MEPLVWFSIVFLVLLKIPCIYLCYVVWWAVKDPPSPGEGSDDLGSGVPGEGGPEPSSWWRLHRRRRPIRRGPHGSPPRRPAVSPAPSGSREARPPV